MGVNPAKPRRLDQALVTAGLADSRTRAQALIAAGVVLVNGEPAKKPSRKISTETLCLSGNPNPWVSRAALKLAHALDLFGLSPDGAVALDVGASTGGFTQVLLARGASRVFALDVGHGQLHPKLAGDQRVVNLQGVNAREIPAGMLPAIDWIVSDVSFISLTKALPLPLSLARRNAVFVGLVKPQFEVGRGNVGKGGIVKDTAAQLRACDTIHGFLKASGWNVTGAGDSPILGSDGNREFLVAARKG